ncbi:DUF2846 domain-containing protein [Lysobacter tyrosinilyticus]
MFSKLQSSALCALLVLSASTFAAQEAPQAEATASAQAAPAAANSIVGAAPADKGQIVFFRQSKMMGAAVGLKIREGETDLVKLGNGKYFVAVVEPGTHQFTTGGEAKDALTLEVEAGETYYVSGAISMGILAGRSNLAPSDEATFAGLKLKPAKK